MTEVELRALLEKMGIQVVRTRGANLEALCPNPRHDDKNPSWSIRVDDPHVHACWSCGFKGTLLSLLLDLGMPLREVRNVLGPKKVKRFSFQVEPEPMAHSAVKPVEDVLEEPEALLWPFEQGAKPLRNYMRSRGFDPKLPCWNKLYWDEENRRVVFPWYWEEEFVGATGRAVSSKEPVKILSYGEGFKKSHFLYAPYSKREQDTILVLCEGEIDAWTARLWMKSYALALGHGKFSLQQIEWLNKLVPTFQRVVLAFDRDSVGKGLTEHACELFPVEMLQHFVIPKPFKDLNELYQYNSRKDPWNCVMKLDRKILKFSLA